MSVRQWIEAFVSKPQTGVPVAVLLALLPLPHWPAVVLMLLIILRTGGSFSYLGYVLVLAAAYFSEQHYNLTGMNETLGPFLTLFLPAGIMAVVLRETRQLGMALETGAYVLIGIIMAGYLISGPITLEAAEAIVNARRQTMGGFTEVDALANMTHMTLRQATLYLLLVWPVLFYAFQTMLLLIARYCQAWLFYRGGFKKDFHALRLSKLSATVFGILFVLGNFLPHGKEMLPDGLEYVIIFQLGAVALGLLVFVGLGIVHWYLKYKKVGAWAVGVLYASIMVVGPIVLPALAVLALVDAGMDLRRRIRGGV